jgi:2-oxoglutarate dehydrogenase complex dehydrogenase (E1) component-like enzyme
LNRIKPLNPKELDLARFGLNPSDSFNVSELDGILHIKASGKVTVKELEDHLRSIYSNKIAYEISHLSVILY